MKWNNNFAYFQSIVGIFIIQLRMNCNQKSYSRIHWVAQEEQLLKELRQDRKMSSWKMISKIINKKFPAKSRSGKQCRERYMNYIKFHESIHKKYDWTVEEDLLLFQKFVVHGPKWVKIGRQMPGRSQNCLKNRFYGAIRKITRKIQKIQKQKNRRCRKMCKPQSLIKFLQISETRSLAITQQCQVVIQAIRRKIIQQAVNPEQEFDRQSINQLILLQEKVEGLQKQGKRNIIKSQSQNRQQGQGTNQQTERNQQTSKNQIDSGKEEMKEQPKTSIQQKIVKNYIITSHEHVQGQMEQRKIDELYFCNNYLLSCLLPNFLMPQNNFGVNL